MLVRAASPVGAYRYRLPQPRNPTHQGASKHAKSSLTHFTSGDNFLDSYRYSLKRWTALTAFLLDGNVAIDNNHIENLMRPWAMGRKAWLFAGSELAGQRAAVVMSLVQSARMHGHDPWAYLKDVLTRLPGHLKRLPGHLNSRIDELLPHRWQPVGGRFANP